VNYKDLLIPAIIVLVGVVMLLAGSSDAARVGGKIMLVIFGALALFLVFGVIVARAL
jgi:hypothetical protein